MVSEELRISPAGAMARPQEKLMARNAAAEKHGKYKLDELNPARVARNLVLFKPSEKALVEIMAKARLSIPGLAQTADVLHVMSHNSDSVFAIARKNKFDEADPHAEGFIAMLPLNKLGAELLALDAFETSKPNVKFLAKPGERPEAIYWWAVFAPGSLAAGMALFMQKINSDPYAGLDVYARPVTPEGRKFLQVLGFKEGAHLGDTLAPHLWIFRRRPNAPLYDSYVPDMAPGRLGITVARNLEDLGRIIALRSAVYIGEQECPYEEEFDGNDLAATHLLAYMGDEPAGGLRVRFFADFAKLERLVVRKEFRKTRAAFQLVNAALDLCRKKGYRRAYGHSQTRLVNFWGRFGFRTFDGAQSLVFSDFDYVELAADLEPDSGAVRIGGDPYLIIRPEGRWHEKGVLERSASRPVTSPSIVEKS